MPENTLAGIAAALADGVDGIEFDVRATADGAPVLIHDASLQRTAGDARDISAVSAEELAALPLGRGEERPVPALRDALAAIDGRCTAVIEVKQRGVEPAVAAAVREAAATAWCWLWTFDPTIATACRAELPAAPVSLLVGPRSAERFGVASPLELAAEAGLAGLGLERSLVSPQAVAEAHGRGLAVYTWTVDEPEEIERVLAAGADAVCGNYPRLIRSAIDRRGT